MSKKLHTLIINKELHTLRVFQDQLAQAIDSCKTGEQAGLMKASEMLVDYIREVISYAKDI